MHVFYHPLIEKRIFTLDKIESAHVIKVLRLNVNDIIYLTDGLGKLHTAKIINAEKKACVVEIVKVTNVPKERNYSLHIAISPTKNIERFEWFLEKTTEIGIDRIIPLLTANSERRVIKEERLKKVMISAMKQSQKTWLPEITPFISFNKLVKQQFDGGKYVATVNEPPENHLGKLYIKGSNTIILIGPEGDFQQEEMNMAKSNGFIQVSLGKSRLRTETAGLVACHTVNLKNSL